MDTLEFEGEANTVTAEDRIWLALLENEKTGELRSRERCSAKGGPRGVWAIKEDRLWLVGLRTCGGRVKLEDVYNSNGDPILAEWISGGLFTQKGEKLCSYHHGGEILKTGIHIRIERGLVKNVVQLSNEKHPAVPTVDDLRKLLPNEIKHQAEELVANRDVPCWQQHTLRELGRGMPEPDPTPQGSTFREMLEEHVRLLQKRN